MYMYVLSDGLQPHSWYPLLTITHNVPSVLPHQGVSYMSCHTIMTIYDEGPHKPHSQQINRVQHGRLYMVHPIAPEFAGNVAAIKVNTIANQHCSSTHTNQLVLRPSIVSCERKGLIAHYSSQQPDKQGCNMICNQLEVSTGLAYIYT